MRRFLVMAVAVASLIAVIAAPILAGNGARQFGASLNGYQETPQTLSVAGTGKFSARLNRAGTELTVKLSWRNLTTPPTQAHIHFGAPATSGGVVLWLCGSATNPGPAGTLACGAATNAIEVTLDAADVQGPSTPPGQGILAGEWEEVLRAMRAGVTYANIHTTTFPGGEVRGRISGSDSDD